MAVVSGLGTALAVAPAAPASAAETIGPITLNCGIVTCSGYLSRSATRAANDKILLTGGGVAGILAAVCAPLLLVPPAVPLGVACGVAAFPYGGWIVQEISDAATQHGSQGACLKVTYTRPVNGKTVITYWSTNNGSYCKD